MWDYEICARWVWSSDYRGQELLHKLGTLVRPGLYSKLEREKTGLTIVPMPWNCFFNPNSALSPNSCIFFFGLGLTNTSCYTLGLFCKKQKHDLSDLSQVTRQLFQIWACNLAQIKKMIFTRLPPQIQVRSFALGVCRAAKHQKGNIFVFVSCTSFHS